MYIAIGKIIKVHGVRGYVKAIAYSELPDRFLHLQTVYIETPGGMQGFLIEDIKLQSNISLLKLKGIETRDAAASLLQKDLRVPEEQQIELPEDNFFIHDLIGLQVSDTAGEYLGELAEVLSNAGNDVYLVRNESREILIPAVYRFVKEIDLLKKTMVVELIEGMLE